MIDLGEYNKLKVDSVLSEGLYLGCEDDEFVLLPKEELEDQTYVEGDELTVFVYKGNEDKLTATLRKPYITLCTFALLKVNDVTNFGAFMDIGLEKDLMVPIKEQKDTMQVGCWYVVFMGLDHQTDRLYGSSKVVRYLQNNMLTVKEGEKVQILVYKKTDMGYSVIINDSHLGLVYENEVFGEINVGDKLEAYIKTIRNDKKIDVSLQPIGYQNFISKGSEKVFRILESNNGCLSVSDKSTPALIYDKFGMSKKAFKKAVGDLYKQRKITISSDGIRMI